MYMKAVLFETFDGEKFAVPCHESQVEDVIQENKYPHIVNYEVISCDISYIV